MWRALAVALGKSKRGLHKRWDSGQRRRLCKLHLHVSKNLPERDLSYTCFPFPRSTKGRGSIPQTTNYGKPDLSFFQDCKGQQTTFWVVSTCQVAGQMWARPSGNRLEHVVASWVSLLFKGTPFWLVFTRDKRKTGHFWGLKTDTPSSSMGAATSMDINPVKNRQGTLSTRGQTAISGVPPNFQGPLFELARVGQLLRMVKSMGQA